MAGRRARSERDARRRSHSQNFLRDSAIAAELVADADIGPSDLVVEIGAGSGILTRALASAARKVVAIELDPSWASRLRGRFGSDPRVRVIEGDALSIPLPPEPFRVLASLPFASTTGVLRRLLDDPRTPLERADLIVQWEAGMKRIQMPPRNLLTICWSPWWMFSLTRRITRRCFRPMPQVDAAMVTIQRRTEPLLEPSDRELFVVLVRAGFERVQVPLSASLRDRYSAGKLGRALHRVSADRSATASDLSARQWIDLFRILDPRLGTGQKRVTTKRRPPLRAQ